MEGNINVGVTPGTHSVTWRKSGSKRLQFFTPAPHHLPPAPAHPFTGKPNPSASRLGLRPCDCVWPTEQGSGANAQSWGQTLRGLCHLWLCRGQDAPGTSFWSRHGEPTPLSCTAAHLSQRDSKAKRAPAAELVGLLDIQQEVADATHGGFSVNPRDAEPEASVA